MKILKVANKQELYIWENISFV